MHDIAFVPLGDVDPEEILRHMADPRVAEHLPLLTGAFDRAMLAQFLEAKAACWSRDGLGHWAILNHGVYVGWGGFQREGDDWDFGLVLKPERFGLGAAITRKALKFARDHKDIDQVTFLLAPSRRSLRALDRLGATFDGRVEHGAETFLKYRLKTS
ncbi:GNAT family N-acetyltransferase [Shimia sp.]|uniref:GNAT family N-acetyltransferase n=1 Tax=Shimia sp. TaxID=1954381 RepID=UPI0032997991